MSNFEPYQIWLVMAAVAYVAFLIGRASANRNPGDREYRRAMEEEAAEGAFSSLASSKVEEIDRLLTSRRKLEAIKLLREESGLGLKTSKMAVERRAAQQGLR